MTQPPHLTDARSLLEALDARGEDPAERRAFDERVWAEHGIWGAVLVTDLSGFTRLTEKHGILHFLAMFRRFQRSCIPIINKHGGSLLKQEADDLVGLFERPGDGIDAGFEMMRTVRKLNEGLEEDEQIGLCVGIEYGRLIRLTDDAFGHPCNVAFKLGEDIARPGEMLIGRSAYERARETGYTLPANLAGPNHVQVGGVVLEHFSVTL